MLTYHIERKTNGTETVIETGPDGSRPVDPQQADYLAWLVSGNVAQVVDVPEPPAPSLAEVKVAKQGEITSGAQAILAPLGAQYCDLERQTWEQQAAEAAAVTANPAAPTPLLTPIAAARGMDVPTLAARILANKESWKVVSGAIVGQRLAYQDQLDAATKVEAVQAIQVAYRLPQA